MAFDSSKFGLGSKHQNDDIPRIWMYDAGTDNKGVVDGSGYFNDVSDRVKVGDAIHANCNDGFGIFIVNANSAGVVDVDNALSVGGTDSD